MAEDSRPHNITPAELPCPSCGEPMLAGWGSTCGRCRPSRVAPKTLALSRNEDLGTGGAPLTLAWLVVLRSPDEKKRGMLVELSAPLTVLTRLGGGVEAMTGQRVEFDDEYASIGHALLFRSEGPDRSATFSIRDRQKPGPSSNGTFVNSQKLGPDKVAMLSDGDTVRVGTTEMLFKSLWLPPGS
jgi:hypothetical protein